MSRKQLAAASGVSERTIGAFEHHNSRHITRANNVALRQALEAANVGFTSFGIEVPDRLATVPMTDEARVERIARIIFRQARSVPPLGDAWRDYERDAKEIIVAYQAP